MAAKTDDVSKPNEIRLRRVFDAAVRLVWEAWTDPEQVKHWWGPRGFTITTHTHDLRTGGSWLYTMHGPDGVDYPNTTKYLEVVQYQKMVYDHGGNEHRPPLFRVTVLFKEIDGKTHMDMTMALSTPEAADATRKFIRKAGGDTTWDRLAEYVAEQASGRSIFTINRSFAAPIDVVFDAWTKPERFCQWLPPTGFTMEFIRCDIRPGGEAFYVMRGQPGGHSVTMHGRVEYREITPPDRLVYTQQFCDESGRITRHPMAPVWPETMLTTVTLTAESAGQTRVTILWEPVGPTQPAEIEAFLKERGGMTKGWTGSLDKLEELLANENG